MNMRAGYLNIRAAMIRGIEWVIILIMGVLVLDVVWQVVTRFVLSNPSSWTEELATLLLIWIALLGASIGFIRHSHLGIDYFVEKLSPRMRLLNEAAVYSLVAFFAGTILLYGGSRIVYYTMLYGQRSAALNVRMGYVYLALPVSGLCIGWFAMETVIIRIIELCRTGRSTD